MGSVDSQLEAIGATDIRLWRLQVKRGSAIAACVMHTKMYCMRPLRAACDGMLPGDGLYAEILVVLCSISLLLFNIFFCRKNLTKNLKYELSALCLLTVFDVASSCNGRIKYKSFEVSRTDKLYGLHFFSLNCSYSYHK